MNASSRWPLSEALQEKYIRLLTANLPLLRAKLEITQEEIAAIIGISRQTYSAIEGGKRMMSWQIYLSLVLFFDANKATCSLLRHLECFPDVLSERGREEAPDREDVELISDLDDQALHAVRTVLMVEYARCSKIPGEAVVKAFDGFGFASGSSKLLQAIHRVWTHPKGEGTPENPQIIPR